MPEENRPPLRSPFALHGPHRGAGDAPPLPGWVVNYQREREAAQRKPWAAPVVMVQAAEAAAPAEAPPPNCPSIAAPTAQEPPPDAPPKRKRGRPRKEPV